MSDINLRYDILNELFNMSVGKAASILSEIIDKKIILKVPDVRILTEEQKGFNISECLPRGTEGNLMVSSISFENKLAGKANLIFPAEKMRTFINLCLNDKELNSYYENNFTDVDFDIIKEIGNIILNSIMGEIGNYTKMNFEYTLPEVKIFHRDDFGRNVEGNGYVQALILYISFEIEDTKIEGAIVVNLTLNSLNQLIKNIDKIGDELNE